ncbi:MAG: HAMP domain-containing histidine kinase [Bacteroidetes bacterium]|nr:HAMP domain-containing histidine kinase [Bacteroidota bacterium]
MVIRQKLSDWESIICQLQVKGQSFGVGVFNREGFPIETNNAMRYFLDIDLKTQKPNNSLINPSFDKLRQTEYDGKIFEGLLTIGNYGDLSYTFNSVIYKENNLYLVYCEADIPHLFSENKKMSTLNQEINNLQRQLIKEKKKLETTLIELKETQQMLIHAEKMSALGKMVAGIAHEINNPIAFVYSNIYSIEENVNDLINSHNKLELLLRNIGENKLNDEIDIIRKEHEIDFVLEDLPDMTNETKKGIERVKIIVEDLRSFSRLDEASIKTIDLTESVRSTLVIAGAAIKEKNVNCTIDAPNELFMECYPGQLNQALLNIIMNAIQAVDEGGEIIIKLEDSQNEVHISVCDNGSGIPENIQDKIFEPFFTTKPVGSGTGLGLSIAYKIINDLHKGSLLVTSKEGQGATFDIIIPHKY